MDKTVEKYKRRRDARVKARMDSFNENDHPRDENGRFTSGGGGKSAGKSGRRPTADEKIIDSVRKAKFKKISEPGKLSVYKIETAGGQATVEEREDYIPGRNKKWKISGYGLNEGTGEPEYADTFASARRIATDMICRKSGVGLSEVDKARQYAGKFKYGKTFED